MRTKYSTLPVSVKAKNWILLLPLLLNVLAIENALAQWTQSQFIIGTFWDPCLSTNTNINNTTVVNQHKARFQKAKDAYFNLLTGSQSSGLIVQTEAGMDYALYIASQVGLKYLVLENRFYNPCTCPCPQPCPQNKPFDSTTANAVTNHYKGLESARRNAMYGYHIKDEPPPNDPNFTPHIKAWVSHFKTNDNSKRAFEKSIHGSAPWIFARRRVMM